MRRFSASHDRPSPERYTVSVEPVARIERSGKPRRSAASAKATEVQAILGAAFNDYIAARVLLLSQLLLQRGILASSAIEKYFKVILAFRGNRSAGHLKKAHMNAVRNFSPELFATLNQEYLELLRRLYRFRYPDALPKHANVVIADREFLAELDHTALAIHGGLTIEINGTQVNTALEEALRKGDNRLMAGNHVIGSLPKQDYIAKEPQLVYEARCFEPGRLMEMTYVAEPTNSDGNFLREGLLPGRSDFENFYINFKVLQPTTQPEDSGAGASA